MAGSLLTFLRGSVRNVAKTEKSPLSAFVTWYRSPCLIENTDWPGPTVTSELEPSTESRTDVEVSFEKVVVGRSGDILSRSSCVVGEVGVRRAVIARSGRVYNFWPRT